MERIVETTSSSRHPGHAASTDQVLDSLNDLLQLDHDAIGAYEVAIDKLQDRVLADRIEEFKHDHQRHISVLNDAITTLGGTPRNEPHATGPFKQALQSLGGLAGDKGLLMAWRTNESQVKTKYMSAAADSVKHEWPMDVRRTVERNALDEERHHRWVVEALEGMGVGSGDTAVGNKVNAARDRAAEVAGSARDRIAGGLAAAGERISSEGERGGKVGSVAERVGGGLSSAAHTLREGEVSELGAELEEHVRRSPAKTLLAAAAAGFVIGRVLRS